MPSPFDAHVHLREGPVSALVTPHVRTGGMDVVYVMVRTCPCPLAWAVGSLHAVRGELTRVLPSVPSARCPPSAQPQPADHDDRACPVVRRPPALALPGHRVPPHALPPPVHHAGRDPARRVQGHPRRQELPARRDDGLRGRHRGLRDLLPGLCGHGRGRHGPQPARRGPQRPRQGAAPLAPPSASVRADRGKPGFPASFPPRPLCRASASSTPRRRSSPTCSRSTRPSPSCGSSSSTRRRPPRSRPCVQRLPTSSALLLLRSLTLDLPLCLSSRSRSAATRSPAASRPTT